MRAYKVELLIVDMDELGLNGIKEAIESVNYPNDCIDPMVMNIDWAEIGEWHDDHPLNSVTETIKEYKRLFK